MTRDVVARMFAQVVVGLRWVLVPAWIAVAAASAAFLPSLGSGEPVALGGLVPSESLYEGAGACTGARGRGLAYCEES